jgi:hypothetical protein
MSKSVARDITLPMLFAVALQGAPAARQGVSSETLDSELQAAVTRGARVGIVLSHGEDFRMTVPPAISALPEDGRAIGADTVAVALQTRWSDRFKVSQLEGTVSIVSPAATVCQAALRRPLSSRTISGTPSEVVFELAKEVDPSLASLPPPGVVGGDVTAASALGQFVALQLDGTSLQGGLDGMISRSNGIGWFAREECEQPNDCRCWLGLITGNGIVVTSYDIAPRAKAGR